MKDEELIAYIQWYYKANGYVPNLDDWRRFKGFPCHKETLLKRFGTYNHFLNEAKLETCVYGQRHRNPGKMIKDLRDAIFKYRSFEYSYLKKSGIAYWGVYKDEFGSWEQALNLAGIDNKHKILIRAYPDFGENDDPVAFLQKKKGEDGCFDAEQMQIIFKIRKAFNIEKSTDRNIIKKHVSINEIIRVFEYYPLAIIAAGLVPEYTRESILRAKDGHICSSYEMMIIDAWLTEFGFQHDVDYFEIKRKETYNIVIGDNLGIIILATKGKLKLDLYLDKSQDGFNTLKMGKDFIREDTNKNLLKDIIMNQYKHSNSAIKNLNNECRLAVKFKQQDNKSGNHLSNNYLIDLYEKVYKYKTTDRDVLRANGLHDVSVYRNRFGSWREALLKAGIGPEQRVLMKVFENYRGEPIISFLKQNIGHKGDFNEPQKLLIKKVKECCGDYNLIRKVKKNESINELFGTVNILLIAAGFKPNINIKSKYIAMDGHECDSKQEAEIDDFLILQGIEHQIHIKYPRSKLICDFLIGRNIYIEYTGFSNSGRGNYYERLKSKEEIAITEGIHLIIISDTSEESKYMLKTKIEDILKCDQQ